MVAVLEDRLDLAIQQIGSTILGKERAIRLALSCLLGRGHLLIEDLPGMGKTTLAHALARCLGLQYQRIQFTSDLLPADILGAAVYERQRETFVFHPGPIFAQLILADEINRATPKTQSALLEAMEEGQVTIEGETRKLPEPFFVIATQNPAYQIGTFPLPESQLDRFLMRIELGYPDAQAERALLEGEDRREILARLPVCMTPEQLHELQGQVSGVHVAAPLLDYVQALLAFSRQTSCFRGGFRRAPGWGCSGRRGLGRCCIVAAMCCRKTYRRCCRRWWAIACTPATIIWSSRQLIWSGSCWAPWRCRPELRPPCSG